MTTAAEMQAKVAKFELNMGRADDFINGEEDTEVAIDGGRSIKSLAKLEQEAQVNIDEASNSAALALSYKDAAEDARDESLNAKDLALLAALAQGPFDDTDAGIAATVDGDYFFTVNPANVYLNDNDTPVLQDEIATLGRSLGTFTSPLIADNQPIKSALESLIEGIINRGFVSVKDKGAVGDGTTNDSAAFQAAVDEGKLVYVPVGRYLVADKVEYAGRVNIYGEGEGSVIIADDTWLDVTNYTGSTIDNLRWENLTTPWTIQRDPGDWGAVPTISLSNDGYQPTVNDQDIWSSLTTAQQNQDIGPKVLFHEDGSHVRVTRIYGRFVSILILDAQHSTVEFCDFKAGKNFAGGIVFWNINSQIGFRNVARFNAVRMPSFSGVAFARNTDGEIDGNDVSGSGESGIKTWQDDIIYLGETIDARCYRMKVNGQTTRHAYFDGLDLSANYIVNDKGGNITNHKITNNRTYGNRQTGYYLDGQDNDFSGNEAWDCRKSGIDSVMFNSRIEGNTTRRCNLSNAASGVHQVGIVGDGNVIKGNYALQTVANGAAFYMPGDNDTDNNTAIGGNVFEGNPGSVVSRSSRNFGANKTRNEQTVPMSVRQNSDAESALRLLSEFGTSNKIRQEFVARAHLGLGPIAVFEALLGLGTPGDELGLLQVLTALDGELKPALTMAGSPSQPGERFVALSCTDGIPDLGVIGDSGKGTGTLYYDKTAGKGGIVFRLDDGSWHKTEHTLIAL